MPARIEDYALIGDLHTAALVTRDGSIDWMCLPRFDSGACFAALLGEPKHGRWLLAPAGDHRRVRRRYRDDTLILETEFETADGAVTLIDFMPVRDREPNLVRIVEGRRGQVRMTMELVIRFDYGSIVPWVQRIGNGISATGGPDTLLLNTPVELRGEAMTTVAEFTVAAGERVPFVLTWHPSYTHGSMPPDAEEALAETEEWWTHWAARCTYQGDWRGAVMRSLITLKALSYGPTGGIVAAPTTSLPEHLGGVRNWDYRFCWLRDATFTLYCLLNAGYREEARAWGAWLLRAVAGSPEATNIMYGLAGERRLTELVLDWLPGYQGAKPVRIGNAAHGQFQLDIYGEVLDVFYQARRFGLKAPEASWNLERALVTFLEDGWQRPDEGIWEVRGPRRHFTHSKVMAWLAVDRAVKSIERFGLHGPLDRWRQLRDTIHQEVCAKGYDAERGSFVQYFGAKDLDASLLMVPLVGFLPPDDPRMVGTVAAIQRELIRDGFVLRYVPREAVDGLPPGEGAFLPCTFWLADNLALQGRYDEARAIFERLLGLCNDVGLLSEEYDVAAGRLVGNFPQAFSHIGLVNTAMNLAHADKPCHQRPTS